MLVSDFDFELPKELIAQYPTAQRDAARMMLLKRDGSSLGHQIFSDFASHFRAGDCLVLNDTKVIPARLWARRPESGGRIQVFMLESRGGRKWQAFLKPGRRMRIGATAVIEGTENTITVLEKSDDGACLVEFDTDDILDILEKHGSTPLP
ncbi:MAG: S-adenosylmethionine:tRNA ribosyltransferase-isomerase, partial [Victivallales bacterium]|nr:S-adenosylmethionine:tRNA ribosyltransferase-isomerase [Victivallales bacterium]